MRTVCFSVIVTTAFLIGVCTTSTAEGKTEAGAAERILELFKKNPQSFQITMMSHYSDDDFGYHFQTARVPPVDSLYPMVQIGEEQAASIIAELAKTGFAKDAVEQEGDARFRPERPEPVRRVFSIVLRVDGRAFAEGISSDDDLKARVDAIAKALEGSKLADRFRDTFAR